ncbi:hypothetical protein HPB47_020501, partial [Ixodes persulcatus]
ASTHALVTARSYWLAPAMAELTTQPTERLSSATSPQGAEQPRGDDHSPPGGYGSPPDVIIIYGLGGLLGCIPALAGFDLDERRTSVRSRIATAWYTFKTPSQQ